MTHTVRLPVLASAMAAAFCLLTFAPAGSNEAAAQTSRERAVNQAYYNGYGAGLQSGYGNGGYGYTGYGNGPYVYGSAPVYVAPSAIGYGYRNGISYYRGFQYDSRAYYRTYSPNYVRYYSPYGNGAY